MLAGISRQATYYEIFPYLEKAIAELGLEAKQGEAAAISYAGYYVKKIARGEKVRENLSSLRAFGMQWDKEQLTSDFVQLEYAWQDLSCGEDAQYYWPSATLENIEMLVEEHARLWLEDPHLSSHGPPENALVPPASGGPQSKKKNLARWLPLLVLVPLTTTMVSSIYVAATTNVMLTTEHHMAICLLVVCMIVSPVNLRAGKILLLATLLFGTLNAIAFTYTINSYFIQFGNGPALRIQPFSLMMLLLFAALNFERLKAWKNKLLTPKVYDETT